MPDPTLFSDGLYLNFNRFFDHKAAHFVLVAQHDGGAAAGALIRADYVAQGNTA